LAERNGSRPRAYRINYKRPQFAPGKSGNPRGRPEGPRAVAAILQSIIHQKIAVTENRRTRRILASEVVVRRLLDYAMRNDAMATKRLLPLIDR
jgi:hypothetical protein